MTYLTGKRLKTIPGKIEGETDERAGVIVSEPFREGSVFAYDGCTPMEWITYVAVLWENGTMSGEVDIEKLVVLLDESEKILVPKRILQILASEVGQKVARHGVKSCNSFDDNLPEGAPDTGDFYDAVCELRKICNEL